MSQKTKKMERSDELENSGDPNQRVSDGGEGSETGRHVAECCELSSDDDVEFVCEKPGRGPDENPPPRDNREASEPVIGSSDPVQRPNVEGAGRGFKKKPRPMKKGGKKLRMMFQFVRKSDGKPRPVFKRRGPSHNFKTDDEDIQMLLDKYDEVRVQYRRLGKNVMEAFRDFRRQYWYLLCNGQESMDGPVQGVKVGMCFTWRTELFLVGLHHRLQAGIDFIPPDKSPVWIDNKPVHIAVSVVVTGNFEDDVDEGEKILYCGEGGRPYETGGKGRQSAHQTLTKGNLALYNSSKLGRSVRVIRKHRDESSPSGSLYSYDGMYKVSRSYTQRGKRGYRVYMFELNRLSNQGELMW